jgi:hypothetical protein
MYHPASIASLSPSQISKALKGLPVRVSVGNHHDVELSQEQLKKLSKAGLKGKAATIAMDPYQIQNHMHLLGAGKLKKNVRGNLGRIITSATDRAVRALVGGNITATSKDSGKRLIVAGTDRAVQAIEGSGVNRLKKAGRWEHFANATIRDGIDTAGKAANVYYDSTGPAAQLGFGLKKKRGRPRKHGGALLAAGY